MNAQDQASMHSVETNGIQLRTLYVVGSIAALAIALFSVLQVVVFVLSPPPEKVLDWFTLFHRNEFIGLLDFDFLYILDNILMIFVYLGFYATLHRKNQALMILSVAIGLVAIATFFSSVNAFSMLSLSRQYYNATTETERLVITSAGQAMVSLFSGTSYIVFTVLGSIAPIIISVTILKHGVFSKATAWMGLVANTLPFGLFIDQIGKFFGLLSVPFLIAWFILTGLRLFRLANSAE